MSPEDFSTKGHSDCDKTALTKSEFLGLAGARDFLDELIAVSILMMWLITLFSVALLALLKVNNSTLSMDVLLSLQAAATEAHENKDELCEIKEIITYQLEYFISP